MTDRWTHQGPHSHTTDCTHEMNCPNLTVAHWMYRTSMNATGLIPALRPVSQKEQLEAVWKLLPPGRLAELQLTQEKLNHVCQFPHRMGVGSSSTRLAQSYHSEAKLIKYSATCRRLSQARLHRLSSCATPYSHGPGLRLAMP